MFRPLLCASLLTLLACGGDDGGGASDGLCAGPADCDDGEFCNGFEVCMPGVEGSGMDGCRPGRTPCFAAQTCEESARQCVTRCEVTEDADGDGHRAIECGGDDCDDADGSRFPGNVEVCDRDGRDEDCDPNTLGDLDQDGDGYVAFVCCNPAPGGGERCGEDCDDTRYGAQPGFPELCDELDNDCDGDVDEETREVPWYVDADGDGFGAPGDSVSSCAPVADRVLSDNDCDDSEPTIRPSAVERCDGLDQDCDGEVDEGACDTVAVSVAGAFTLNGVTPDAATCAAAGIDEVRFTFDGGEGAVAFERSVACADGGFDTRPDRPLLRGSYRVRVEALDDSAVVVTSQELVVTALAPLTHLALPPLSLRVGSVCTADVDCEDGVFCNGFERCDRGVGRCIPVDPLEDGTLCELDADPGTLDVCVAGACAAAECGDGVVSESLGEECDDGNLTSEDGCDAACLGDAECVIGLTYSGSPQLRFDFVNRNAGGGGNRGTSFTGAFVTDDLRNRDDALTVCGGQAIVAAREPDLLLVAEVLPDDLEEEARVPLADPVAVACAETEGLLFVISSAFPNDTSATIHSFAVPLTAGATPIDSLTFTYDAAATGPLEPNGIFLQRRPGRSELVTIGDWATSAGATTVTNAALRFSFTAAGALSLAEGPTDIGAGSKAFIFDDAGDRLVQAADDGLAVWPMGVTLPAAGARVASGGSVGAFALFGDRVALANPGATTIGDLSGTTLTPTTSTTDRSVSALAWLYEGSVLVVIANNYQPYLVSADGTTATRTFTGIGGHGRYRAVETVRCVGR